MCSSSCQEVNLKDFVNYPKELSRSKFRFSLLKTNKQKNKYSLRTSFCNIGAWLAGVKPDVWLQQKKTKEKKAFQPVLTMSSERRSNSCWNSFLTTKELGKKLNLSTRFSHINTHMEQSTGKRRWLNMYKLKAAMMRKFRTCSSISSFFPPLIYFLPRLFLIRTWFKPQKHI